jgi:hypothetical protein
VRWRHSLIIDKAQNFLDLGICEYGTFSIEGRGGEESKSLAVLCRISNKNCVGNSHIILLSRREDRIPVWWWLRTDRGRGEIEHSVRHCEMAKNGRVAILETEMLPVFLGIWSRSRTHRPNLPIVYEGDDLTTTIGAS